jgi:hypothetical protein
MPDLIHELVHARDYCDGWVQRGDCRSHVCTELKAYTASERLRYPRIYAALKHNGMLKNHIADLAANSAGGYCGGKAKAKELALKIYDECVGDGRIY